MEGYFGGLAISQLRHLLDTRLPRGLVEKVRGADARTRKNLCERKRSANTKRDIT